MTNDDRIQAVQAAFALATQSLIGTDETLDELADTSYWTDLSAIEQAFCMTVLLGVYRGLVKGLQAANPSFSVETWLSETAAKVTAVYL